MVVKVSSKVVGDAVGEVEGVTLAMMVKFGENDVKSVEDLAYCATDDLTGWTERKDGIPIAIYPASTERDEASFVARTIKRLCLDVGKSWFSNWWTRSCSCCCIQPSCGGRICRRRLHLHHGCWLLCVAGVRRVPYVGQERKLGSMFVVSKRE